MRLAVCGFLAAGLSHAAASLVMSGTAAIGSTGRVITVSITGGSGSLSPTSGITGFTPKLSGKAMAVSSVTASGTTITINLNSMVVTGDTVTVDLATSASSNLTDAGANTPTGQTAYATSNGSSLTGTSILGSNTSVYWLGAYTAGSSGGTNFRKTTGNQARVETVITGTDADVFVFAADTCKITVDGTPSTVTVPYSGVFVWLKAFSGLTNTAHNVRTEGSCHISSDTIYRVAPSSATASSPSGYSQNLYAITSAPFTTYGAIDANQALNANSAVGYPSAGVWLDSDVGVRFTAAATDIWIWGQASYTGTVLSLRQDGVVIATFSSWDGSFTWDLYHLASGLDGLQHQYEIAPYSVVNSQIQTWAIYQVMLPGTGLSSVAQTVHPVIGMYGDSIIFEANSSLTDSTTGSGYLLAKQMTAADGRAGFAGQKVSTFLRDNTTNIGGMATKPKVIIMQGGINDQSLGTVVATFTSDYTTMLTNMAATMPASTVMLCRGITPNNATNSGLRGTYNAAIVTAVANYMAGSPSVKAYYYSTDGWINATTDTVDGTHPNAGGYQKIASLEGPIVARYLYGCSAVVGAMERGCSAVF